VVLVNPDPTDKLEVVVLPSIPLRSRILGAVRFSFCLIPRRAALQFEILALRHQLGVLQRSVKRPKLTAADRFRWAWLCKVWNNWRSDTFIVKPATVIGRHRKGFRLFWTWNIRRGKPGGQPCRWREPRPSAGRLSYAPLR
jgi:hypothetical protein